MCNRPKKYGLWPDICANAHNNATGSIWRWLCIFTHQLSTFKMTLFWGILNPNFWHLKPIFLKRQKFCYAIKSTKYSCLTFHQQFWHFKFWHFKRWRWSWLQVHPNSAIVFFIVDGWDLNLSEIQIFFRVRLTDNSDFRRPGLVCMYKSLDFRQIRP